MGCHSQKKFGLQYYLKRWTLFQVAALASRLRPPLLAPSVWETCPPAVRHVQIAAKLFTGCAQQALPSLLLLQLLVHNLLKLMLLSALQPLIGLLAEIEGVLKRSTAAGSEHHGEAWFA